MTEQCIEAQDKYDVWKYRNSLELKCAPYVGAVNTYKVLSSSLTPTTNRNRIAMLLSFYLGSQVFAFLCMLQAPTEHMIIGSDSAKQQSLKTMKRTKNCKV